MTIDKSPLVDLDLFAFTVTSNIDTSEDIAISINGILSIFQDDVISINNNVIFTKEFYDIDITDEFAVLYTAL